MAKKPCCDKTGLKKGPWSAEENRRLKSYIEKQGMDGGWVSVSQKAELKRCGKSCRLRWLNYLKPGLKHGNYTAEKSLSASFTRLSEAVSRWSIIASQLPGRTDNDVKNHWNTQLKHKWMNWKLQPKWLSFENASWGHRAPMNAMSAFRSSEINFEGVQSPSLSAHIHSSCHWKPSYSFAAYEICRISNPSSSTSVAGEQTGKASNDIVCQSNSNRSCSCCISFERSLDVNCKIVIPNNSNYAHSASKSVNQVLQAKRSTPSPNNSNPIHSSSSAQQQVLAHILDPNNSSATYSFPSAQDPVVTDIVDAKNSKTRSSSSIAEEKSLDIIGDIPSIFYSSLTCSSSTVQDKSLEASSKDSSLESSSVDIFDVLVDLDYYGMDPATEFSPSSSSDSI